MEMYPKRIILRDDTEVVIRPPENTDGEGLFEFFSNIPNSDLLIYKDDLSELENKENWFMSDIYGKVFKLVTLRGNEIIATGTLHKEGLFWLNAAEIKLVVDPRNRGKGIGSKLFNHLLFEVFQMRMRKVIVRFTPDNISFIRIIGHYGFKPETVLRCYIIDENTNEKKDLIIASFNLEEWANRFEFYNIILGGK
ncbi:MAG TPA: GNAT family N-acetyltransferase [Thermodesulfobacteriota bacterium]|jgi:RimJ/RimL family protein N-acetyltransferase